MDPAHPVAEQDDREQQHRQPDPHRERPHHVAALRLAIAAVAHHEDPGERQRTDDENEGDADQVFHGSRLFHRAPLRHRQGQGMSSARQRAAVVLLTTLVGMAVTARLGVWQLSRAAEKRALQSARDERAHLAPLADASLATTAAQAELQHYRPVRLRGTWRAQNTVYLDNRQMDGRPGFFVVTPLLLPGGDAVLVQRGWAPRDMADRTRVPAVPTPAGEVELVGLIAPPPARLFDFA